MGLNDHYVGLGMTMGLGMAILDLGMAILVLGLTFWGLVIAEFECEDPAPWLALSRDEFWCTHYFFVLSSGSNVKHSPLLSVNGKNWRC